MKVRGNSNGRFKLILRRILLFITLVDALALVLSYLATHISPNAFGPIAFFGLAYELILLFTLAFAIIWLFIKPKYALIPVFTILLGFNHLRHYVAITIFDNEVLNPVKILSYNVHIFDFFDLDNREDNRQRIMQFVHKEDPGIACFQEFFHHDGAKDFVTRDTLLKIMGTPYYHERYTHDMAFERYFGTITISKYPIINKGEIPFDNDPNNFCIFSDIDINGKIIRVFNAHIGSIRFRNSDFDFFGGESFSRYMDDKKGQRIYDRLDLAFKKRAQQAEKVAKEIVNSPYPVILCTDMNDTPVSYAYRQFNRYLNDAFVESGNGIGTTYIGDMPANRIDYIFHSEELSSGGFMTHPVDFSDHKPISCLIGLD